jgi:hypothetical protein
MERGVVVSTTIDTLLETFKSLPEEQKHQLASEVLRWSREADHPPLGEDELALAADDVFAALDDDERLHA